MPIYFVLDTDLHIYIPETITYLLSSQWNNSSWILRLMFSEISWNFHYPETSS